VTEPCPFCAGVGTVDGGYGRPRPPCTACEGKGHRPGYEIHEDERAGLFLALFVFAVFGIMAACLAYVTSRPH